MLGQSATTYDVASTHSAWPGVSFYGASHPCVVIFDAIGHIGFKIVPAFDRVHFILTSDLKSSVSKPLLEFAVVASFIGAYMLVERLTELSSECDDVSAPTSTQPLCDLTRELLLHVVC